jgi:hypothetical protein
MIRQSIKEAFGGEVPFTKYIASNTDVAKRLLDAIDTGMSESFSIAPEDQTVDRKRVDLVVRDDDGNVVQVIESQDATGWLDSVHASKIAYYCYEKGCMDGVLLTEDADEHIKGFIRWYNENTPLNIYLFNVVIYATDTGNYVDFIPVMRPFNVKDKKIQRKPGGVANSQEDFREFLQQKFDENKGKFTHTTGWYISSNNIANTGVNVAIHCRKSGYFLVDIYHNNKIDKEQFEQSYREFSPDDEIVFKKVSAYVRRENWEEAVATFDQLVQGLKNKAIACVDKS